MPFQSTNMTTQTGSAYKAGIDADTAALQGFGGKRRNVNGDGLVNFADINPFVALLAGP